LILAPPRINSSGESKFPILVAECTLITLSPKRKFDYLRKNHVCLAKKLAKESLKKRIDSCTPEN